jgi:hypothetical protein
MAVPVIHSVLGCLVIATRLGVAALVSILVVADAIKE